MNYLNQFMNYPTWPGGGYEKKKKKGKIIEYLRKGGPIEYIPGMSNLFIIPKNKQPEKIDLHEKLEKKIGSEEYCLG